MSIREIVIQAMLDASEIRDLTLNENITNETKLLENGLDSLGYAIVVITLEDELGFDPFVEMEDPVYPTTFGEFLKIYEDYKSIKGAK
jgi:acyl carrier protein